VKSSNSEPDEAQRIMTLNKSLDIVLEGTKTMMDAFASKLKTPTYVLYSIFILIPLALVALIPAVSIVGVRMDTVTLVIIYDIGLPLFTFFYRSIFYCSVLPLFHLQTYQPDILNFLILARQGKTLFLSH